MRGNIPTDAILVPDNAKMVFKGEIFDVYQWSQNMFDGSRQTFEMLKRPDTAVVLAVRDGKVVVINEQQPHFGTRLRLPGGRYENSDKNMLSAAKREMLEETGMTFAGWKLIGVRQPVKKIDWLVYTFLATDFLSQTTQNTGPGEKIAISYYGWTELQNSFGDMGYLTIGDTPIKSIKDIDQLLNIPEYGDA